MKREPVLSLHDPINERTWEVPERPIRSVWADARERWLLNVSAELPVAASLVEAPFLEVEAHHGMGVLSLCLIRMDRAAPDWAPLSMGPAVTGCAVRVACRHRTTGEPCVWVATRCTDHLLGSLLPRLGFPDVAVGLQATERGWPSCRAPWVEARVEHGIAAPSRLFATSTAFDDLIARGIRSYGRGPTTGTWSVIDLIKDAPSTFRMHRDLVGTLELPGGCYDLDSICSCAGGRWHWDILSPVDDAGRPLP